MIDIDKATEDQYKIRKQVVYHPESTGWTEVTTLTRFIPAGRMPRCEMCGVIMPDKRPDAKTCSDSCRQRLHRQTLREAARNE